MLDPLLQTYTIEELQIEHLMYLIQEDPTQAYPRGDMGAVQFRTGDPVIDAWEKALADGKDNIDWDSGVDQTFLKRFKSYSKQMAERFDPALAEQRLKEETKHLPKPDHDEFLSSLVGFVDDYTKG